MKKIKMVLATLLLTAVSTAYTIELSLNQSQFSAGDPLILTLTNENWAGEADIYVGLTLPADETFYFLTPSGLVLESQPFQQAQIATGSREILQVANLVPLPPGEYTFYAGVTMPGTLDIIGDIAINSVNFVASKLEVSHISFPDGVVGHSYSFAIEPNSGMPPYQFSLTSGTLPNGLTLNSGLIQGTPPERGSAKLTVQVTDARGDVADIEAVLNVFNVLSFGEHGTFKGCDGLQMAFDASQDLDNIRIEQGTYECHGLAIPEGKDWKHGIKISGGWDSSFENQNDDPALTVFDAKEKGRILTVSSGAVTIEGLSFQNGKVSSDGGGAIYASATVNITNSSFSGNSASYGGAVVYFHYSGNITNSSFNNNRASDYGGALYFQSFGNISNSSFNGNNASYGGAVLFNSSGNITNTSFSSNNASNHGGAVYFQSYGNIIDSSFSSNSASENGGAVSFYGSGNIINSSFSSNSAENGGAVSFYGSGNITNSSFSNNRASYGGAVSFYGFGNIINSSFSSNSAENGGAVYLYSGNIINSTLCKNSASNSGGAFYGSGTIVNSIFAQNQASEETNDITPTGELHVDYTLVNNISGDVNLGAHFIMGDPRFVDAENGDFRLRADSPAINVGDSSVIESYPFLKDEAEIDLDGNRRLVGEGIDLGAYEYQ
ncbi:MAG: Ig domain-containing protein [Pseudomonadota bacterium]